MISYSRYLDLKIYLYIFENNIQQFIILSKLFWSNANKTSLICLREVPHNYFVMAFTGELQNISSLDCKIVHLLSVASLGFVSLQYNMVLCPAPQDTITVIKPPYGIPNVTLWSSAPLAIKKVACSNILWGSNGLQLYHLVWSIPQSDTTVCKYYIWLENLCST